MFSAIPSLVLALAISPSEWLEKDTLDWFGRQGTNWSIVWLDTWKATTNSEGQWWFFPDTNIAWGDYAAGWMEITNPTTSEYAIGRRVVTLPIPIPGYYVAKTGSDTNPGTFDLPFQTVQKGVNAAQSGDTVWIGEGLYLEDVTIPRSGITIDGQGVATVRKLNLNHPFLNVFNLRLSGVTNKWSRQLYIRLGAHHCVVSNSVIDPDYANQVFGIEWEGSGIYPFDTNIASDCLIVSNTFRHGLSHALLLVNGDRNEVRGNRFEDSRNADWVYLFGRSNHIIANVFSNMYVLPGDSGNHPDFIQSFGSQGRGSCGHIIEYNILVNAGGDTQLGMLENYGLTECTDWEFRNNQFIGVALKMSVGFTRVRFYNNLFREVGTNATPPLTGNHPLLYGNTAGRTLGSGGQAINNIYLYCGGASNANTGWYNFPVALTNVSADYNYVGKLGYKPVPVDSLHRSVGSPGGWGTQWWEDHGINGGNPLFVDENGGDYRLATNSPLAGRGTNLSALFNTDFNGNTRPQRWSIGPFEPVEIAPPVYTLTAPSNLVVLN